MQRLTLFRNNKPVITIDGTAGSGKGTLAKKIASSLGYDHLDTGLLYRYLAHLKINEGLNLGDIDKLKKLKINYLTIKKVMLKTELISKASKIVSNCRKDLAGTADTMLERRSYMRCRQPNC